jgi:hypothetical protein
MWTTDPFHESRMVRTAGTLSEEPHAKTAKTAKKNSRSPGTIRRTRRVAEPWEA